MLNKTLISTFALVLFIFSAMYAQIPRERADLGPTAENIFRTPTLIGMSTVETVPAKNLNVTIMHNFGVINKELFHNFLGLDLGATVRLGIDYGITNSWAIGIGRTSPQKLFDFRTKIALLKQTETNSIPISIALKGDVGVNTSRNGFDFPDRLNFLLSAMLARNISDRLSLQVSPLFSHFNSVATEARNDHFALGMGGEFRLSERWAIIGEYYAVLGERTENTVNAFAVGVDIETGGHVFQLFIKSSNWHNEQHIIAQNTENFWDGDIRFGFNVNRIFGIGTD